jgi:hypothetical protein
MKDIIVNVCAKDDEIGGSAVKEKQIVTDDSIQLPS